MTEGHLPLVAESSGMLIQSEKFIKSHQDNYKKKGKIGLALNLADRISINAQEQPNYMAIGQNEFIYSWA